MAMPSPEFPAAVCADLERVVTHDEAGPADPDPMIPGAYLNSIRAEVQAIEQCFGLGGTDFRALQDVAYFLVGLPGTLAKSGKALSDIRFIRAEVISDLPTSGSNAGNNWGFSLYNVTQDAVIGSGGTTTDDAELVCGVPWGFFDFWADGDCPAAAGDVIEFRIVKTGNPTDLSSAKLVLKITVLVQQ